MWGQGGFHQGAMVSSTWVVVGERRPWRALRRVCTSQRPRGKPLWWVSALGERWPWAWAYARAWASPGLEG